MLALGHNHKCLAPLIAKANENAKAFLSHTQRNDSVLKSKRVKMPITNSSFTSKFTPMIFPLAKFKNFGKN